MIVEHDKHVEHVSAPQHISFGERVKAHVRIARLDHSIKNLFVLPGIIIPLSVDDSLMNRALIPRLIWAFVSLTLLACSNYVINEVLDAPFDRLHPTKRMRPAALGLVHSGAAYVQWLLMMIAGVAIGYFAVGKMFALAAIVLWVMGCLYNFPPIRTKDLPYVDVLTESVNNPLRMLLGWYAVTELITPPVSLLLSYWFIGCYFMALKRFSEMSEIGDRTVSGAYRKSFRYYTPESLLVSVVFYASASMLFFGAFTIRYRLELLLAYPLVAITMAIYFRLSFQKGSSVQNPEKLYREPLLMGSFAATAVLMIVLLFVDMPKLSAFFLPTLPVTPTHTAPVRTQ